jgi:hypothetical protein
MANLLIFLCQGPDMYIDKADHHRCRVDPEWVADLDKVRLPFDSDYPAPATPGQLASAPRADLETGAVYLYRKAS